MTTIKAMEMRTIYSLCFVLAVAHCAAIRIADENRQSQNTFSAVVHSTLTSICPTELRTVVVDTAIHYTNRRVVRLAHLNKGERTKFSIGSCRSRQPISYTPGICAITMQRYRTYIRVTKYDVKLLNYRDCKRVPGHPFIRDCLEWIELPGLCQLKISI